MKINKISIDVMWWFLLLASVTLGLLGVVDWWVIALVVASKTEFIITLNF